MKYHSWSSYMARWLPVSLMAACALGMAAAMRLISSEEAWGLFPRPRADDAVAVVNKIHRLSRQTCRQVFEQRFSAERMAVDCVEMYRRQIHCYKPNGTRGRNPLVDR